jgi:hypothetical protein
MTNPTMSDMDKAYYDGLVMQEAYKENAKRDLAAYVPPRRIVVWDGNSDEMRDDYVMTDREVDAREAQETREQEER